MAKNHILNEYIYRENTWDEMYDSKNIRKHYSNVFSILKNLDVDSMSNRHRLAGELFLNQGITFTVYNNNEGIERIFPFDIIPRIITGAEWDELEKGIAQRLTALNLFLNDIYHEQNILHDGIISPELIASCPHYTREAYGIDVPYNIYVHISGIDLIRGSDGKFYVLEDNLRTPSGVSYMLENREVTKRIFPDMLASSNVRSISHYPMILHEILLELASSQVSAPYIVILTPGMFNSAYYEHTFLAKQMGVDLVEGRDLVVDNHKVYTKTTNGLKQVHVIYRRVDDDFLDPLVFRQESLLGVPGLLSAYRKGNVVIVNAVGNGVADDKAVYAHVPDMIKYYLNETPILNNIPTYQLSDPDALKYTLSNINNLVVKSTNQSGGYGMIMGNAIDDNEWAKAKIEIEKNPRNYVAQPIIQLSTVPCFINGKIEPRHVDLRPYALCGPHGVKLVSGGLTRVALTEGSLVVNSSQGGGSKDTWIIDTPSTN
ncbi:circularly permuted type 2 ATP-grasp protein [Olivibacter sp. SDN3]|uniref:circularly permuted type 2 ATP-grasp protein n=1 Tax=Olivibacter sp. SDN3 TaxID=2764720 RepID=UPI0016518EBF|nr:circularly permuted type 2 ATP-grasp protein [Olivibacter sp. SDN3]QNL52071.1 circularly permuted type 2 ATP-grasp protein [Olivibacter sp. SDN3]